MTRGVLPILATPEQMLLGTDPHCTATDDSLLSRITPRGSFHCQRVGPMDDSRGGADRRGRGRTLVRRQRKPDTLVEAQPPAEECGPARAEPGSSWLDRAPTASGTQAHRRDRRKTS